MGRGDSREGRGAKSRNACSATAPARPGRGPPASEERESFAAPPPLPTVAPTRVPTVHSLPSTRRRPGCGRTGGGAWLRPLLVRTPWFRGGPARRLTRHGLCRGADRARAVAAAARDRGRRGGARGYVQRVPPPPPPCCCPYPCPYCTLKLPPSARDSRPAGSLGDAATFSFYANKVPCPRPAGGPPARRTPCAARLRCCPAPQHRPCYACLCYACLCYACPCYA